MRGDFYLPPRIWFFYSSNFDPKLISHSRPELDLFSAGYTLQLPLSGQAKVLWLMRAIHGILIMPWICVTQREITTMIDLLAISILIAIMFFPPAAALPALAKSRRN
jgi:hypothetical protein